MQGKADPVTRYLGSLNTEGSRETQRYSLVMVARAVGVEDPRKIAWHAMSLSDADALAAKLRGSGAATRTVNRYFAAIRGVLNVCRKEGWLLTPTIGDRQLSQYEHYESLCDSFKSRKPKSFVQPGRVLSDSEIVAFFAHCKADKNRMLGLRDAAIFAIGVGAGLRCDEIAKLTRDRIGKDGTMRVHGKGSKDRSAFLPPSAFEHVQKWLAAMNTSASEVFAVRVKGGTWRAGMSKSAVWRALKNRRIAARIEPFKPHDLRRTFVTRQLKAGTPVGMVAATVGHESIQTTAGYDITQVEERKRAIETIDLPAPTPIGTFNPVIKVTPEREGWNAGCNVCNGKGDVKTIELGHTVTGRGGATMSSRLCVECRAKLKELL